MYQSFGGSLTLGHGEFGALPKRTSSGLSVVKPTPGIADLLLN